MGKDNCKGKLQRSSFAKSAPEKVPSTLGMESELEGEAARLLLRS